MKRQKYLGWVAALALGLLLTGCRPEVPPDPPADPPDPAPIVSLPPALLAVSAEVDWNDVPEVWVGTGGSRSAAYLRRNTYLCVTDTLCQETYLPTEEKEGVTFYRVQGRMTGLRDKALQARINQQLQTDYDRLAAENDFFQRNVTDAVRACDPLFLNSSVYPAYSLCGSLLSVGLYRNDDIYAYDAALGSPACTRSRFQTAVCTYDLSSGRQLTLSDLFVDGTDLNALLNPRIAAELASLEGEIDWRNGDSYGGLIRPFRGLPRDYPYFSVNDTHLNILFPTDNPYIDGSCTIGIPLEALETFLAQPAASPAEYLDSDVPTELYFRISPTLQLSAKSDDLLPLFGQESLSIRPYLLTGASDAPALEAINRDLQSIYADLAAQPLPAELAACADDLDAYLYAYSDVALYRGYVHLNISIMAGHPGGSDLMYHFNRFYDRATGQPIPLSAVLRCPDEALACIAGLGLVIDDPAAHYNWYCYAPAGIFWVCADNGPSPSCEVPACYLNTDFFTHP